jgi:hypothetical protein
MIKAAESGVLRSAGGVQMHWAQLVAIWKELKEKSGPFIKLELLITGKLLKL